MGPRYRTHQKLGSLVVLNKNFQSNFCVKAAQINDRKLHRIDLIISNLRSLSVVDFSELSRQKFHQKFLLRTTK